jgi:esterase
MGYGLNWRKIVSGLESSERVLTYDQRGHGKSWKPMTGYASEDYAEDLFLITEELGWEKFILVGHSMGGRNALVFAHKFPQKVEKLVLEDIGPEGKPEALDYYKKLLGLVPTPFATKLQAKEFFLNEFPGRLVTLGHHENAETLGQYFYANLVESPHGGVDWRFSKEAIFASVLEGRAKDHWAELRQLPMPTLVIRGEKSKELDRDVFQRMGFANPNVETVEISNAGHWVHSEQSQEFLRVIRQFAGVPL